MITCRVYHDGSLKVEKPFDARTVDEARASDQRVWIDVVDPTDDELTELQAKLGLHELAIEDSRRSRAHPTCPRRGSASSCT